MKPHSPEMATDLGQSVAAAARQLAAAGVASPRVDAELLAAHVLGVSRGQLVIIDDLSDADRLGFDTLIARRAMGEPLQHLTGRAPFRRLDLAVGPGVFIPRPETELIVELAASALETAERVVDLCAGSGAIALAVANEYPGRWVVAVEQSADAIQWLRRNAEAQSAAGDPPIGIVEADMTAPDLLACLAGQIDVVLSNPPYVPEMVAVPSLHDTTPTISVEVSHDPPVAVFAGRDGLALMPALFIAAARLLRPDGMLVVEHDETHGSTVPAMLRASGEWKAVTEHVDLTGRPRFASAVRR